MCGDNESVITSSTINIFIKKKKKKKLGYLILTLLDLFPID